jgi:ribose 5-phosphate isomerase B
MRVAVGTDERTPATDAVVAWLADAGHEVVSVADELSGCDGAWPAVGRRVGEAVATGAADVGVVWCWTGTGVSIAATKVPGVRAALCTDAETARGARRWNDANVVALSLRLTTGTVAVEVVEAFLATGPDPSEAATIAALEPR